MTSSSGSADKAWLLYDADCGLCKFVVARVLELDRARRLRPVALQDQKAMALLPGMSVEERMRSFHLVDASGTVIPRATASPSSSRRCGGFRASPRGSTG